MFIYLTMQGLGELVEVFSQLIQMEQGALGLFFELNYILGVVLYIFCFIFREDENAEGRSLTSVSLEDFF